LSVHSGDNCVANTDHRPCLIRNILGTELSSELAFFLVVEYFSSVEDFFDYLLPSSTLNILKVSKLTGSQETLSVSEVVHKYVCLPGSPEESFVVFPTIHLQ